MFSVCMFLLLDCCGGGGGSGSGGTPLLELISTHMVMSTQATDGFLAFCGLIMKLPLPRNMCKLASTVWGPRCIKITIRYNKNNNQMAKNRM